MLLLVSLVLALTPTDASRALFGGTVLLVDNTVYISEPSGFREPGQVHVARQQGDGSWAIGQSIFAAEGMVGDRFGTALAVQGDLMLVGAPAALDGRGAAYVFRRGPGGMFSQIAELTAPTAEASSGFGASVALVNGSALVGAPGAEGGGAVHAFVANAGEWVPVATVSPGNEDGRFGGGMTSDGSIVAVSDGAAADGAGGVYAYSWNGVAFSARGSVFGRGSEGDRFGSAIDLQGTELLVGAPGMAESGAALTFSLVDGTWQATGMIPAPEGYGRRARFGEAVQLDGDVMWIAAPGHEDGVLVRVLGGGETELVRESGLSGNPSFGGGFAAYRDFLAVGATGDAYGEGTAFFYRREGDGWTGTDVLYNDGGRVAAISGTEIECADGRAGAYSCNGVDLTAFLPNEDMEINRGVRLNDIWGWTDPETGREYALVGHMEAMAIVDVSDPTGPVYLGTLPRTEGSRGSTWRDIKVFRDHAFIVADGAGQHGMQVLDLRQLRDLTDIPVTFEPTAYYDGIASSHNIVINEATGFAYTVGNSSGGETCGGGLHMIDIRDPLNPTFVGCFTHTADGVSGSTHDAQCVTYSGPDSEHLGKEICVSSNGSALSISDVSDKASPEPLSLASYPNYAYVHQGWFTDDHRYFYQNDEADELSGLVDRTRTLIWDLTDLDDPTMIGEFYGPTNATDHNLYVDGRFMYQTNNASGLRIVDISDPENPVEVGHFDTTPYGNDNAGFNGTWSSYPYFESGTIVVTSRREGLFLVRKRTIDT